MANSPFFLVMNRLWLSEFTCDLKEFDLLRRKGKLANHCHSSQDPASQITALYLIT